MKKYISLIICIMLLSFTVPETITATDNSTNSTAQESENQSSFVNGFIILPHANDENVIKTSQAKVSILGACDVEFDLYVTENDIKTEVTTTKNGYFAIYAELEEGDNLFVFENGEAVVELTVVYEKLEISDNAQTQKPKIEYFDEPIPSVAIHESISRFYDGDDNNHGTPLRKGTGFDIIAEYKDMYIIQDGSYVFKNNVSFIEDLQNLGDEVTEGLTEPFYPLYSAVLSETEAEFTVYDKESGEYTVTTVPYNQNGENRVVIGYYAEFLPTGGEIVFHLKYAPEKLSDAVVLIDAGHGGTDPGALGPPGKYGLMEKDFNLYVAKRTVEYLKSYGIDVIFLRDNDEHFPVVKRLEHFADLTNLADLSVSVHSNSMSITEDFFGDVGSLMFYTLGHSETAANMITEQLTALTEQEFRPAIVRNFAMSRYSAAPSMLFEMGYVCNPDEYERLTDETYLDLIGDSLGEGIVQYLLSVIEGDELTEIEEIAATSKTTAAVTQPQYYYENHATSANAENQRGIFDFTTVEIAFLCVIFGACVLRVIYELKK